MKATLVVLACVVAIATAGLSCTDGSLDCGEVTMESAPFNSIPSTFPTMPLPDVRIANPEFEALALSAQQMRAENNLTTTWNLDISVEEIVAWINAGGSNPLETHLIQRLLGWLNSAGVHIAGGSLVYQMLNGPQEQLSGGCTSVYLDGGWQAYANLHPGFTVNIQLGVNQGNLVVDSHVRADTDFGMSGHIHAKFGKKVFKKCIRLGSKKESIRVGAYMVLDNISRLELRPFIEVDPNWNLIMGFQPAYQIRGDLLVFNPTAKASVTIFGIHIKFIENAINKAIKDGIRRTFTQRTVDEQFRAVTTAVQNTLNDLFAPMRVVIPLVTRQDLLPHMQNAVNNIITLQANNM